MEDQMQTLGGNVEELASPGHRLDLQAVQRGQRWIVGLECAEGDKIDASESCARHTSRSGTARATPPPASRAWAHYERRIDVSGLTFQALSGPVRRRQAEGNRKPTGDTPVAAAPLPRAMPGAASATARRAADPPRRLAGAARPAPPAQPWTHRARYQVDRTSIRPQRGRRYSLRRDHRPVHRRASMLQPSARHRA